MIQRKLSVVAAAMLLFVLVGGSWAGAKARPAIHGVARTVTTPTMPDATGIIGTLTPSASLLPSFAGTISPDHLWTGSGPNAIRSGRIAYIRGSVEGVTDVASVRPSGRGDIDLTTSNANELYVDVSPNGQTVAFTRFGRRGGDIYSVPISGGETRRLTADRVHDELPIWSPDSARIAFVRFAGGADAEIFVMNADGSGRERVTKNDEDDVDPRWSPDGTKLLYHSGNVDENAHDVFVIDLATSAITQVTQEGVNDLGGEWSPDGTRIVYGSYVDDQWDVYVVSSDGSGRAQLTADAADDYFPKWSPDGTQLLYMHGRLEGELPPDQVFLMSADGSGERSLSAPRLDAFSAVWAPRGNRIAFIGETGRDLNWEIYTVAIDGSDLTRVTRSEAMEFDPSWGAVAS